MGPVFLVDFTLRLGAVLRRCNAVLCGGLGGVDAIGEKVRIVDLTVAEPHSSFMPPQLVQLPYRQA